MNRGTVPVAGMANGQTDHWSFTDAGMLHINGMNAEPPKTRFHNGASTAAARLCQTFGRKGKTLMTTQSHSIAALVSALDDEDYRKQEAVIQEVVAIGEPAIVGLTQALEEKSIRIQFGAVMALSRIGKLAESAVPALLRILRHGKRPERPDQLDLQAAVADALGNLGDPVAVPALVEALQDVNYLCVRAALALGNLGDSAAVDPLVRVLMDKDKFWVPRGAAAVALGSLGKLAEPAIPALNEALTFDSANSGEKWDERAREAVADALRRIGDPSPSSLKGRGYRYEMWGMF